MKKLVTLFVFYLFFYCSVPINQDIITQVKDTIPPVIKIQSPKDQSSYPESVLVNGIINDYSSNQGVKGQISSFTYQVQGGGYIPETKINFNSAGFFEFNFSTNNFSGPILITFTAIDWNKNKTNAAVTLLDKGAFPSFQAIPANETITLVWEDVPLSNSYSLYYTTDNSLPSVQNGTRLDGVRSPFELKKLKNATIYTFLLQSHSSKGTDNWSGIKKAIPLSPFTLNPTVTGDYKNITIQWPAIKKIEDTDFKYQVWKSTSYNGPYEIISAYNNDNFYTDLNVAERLSYFYKISVNQQPPLFSSINSGKCKILIPEQNISRSYSLGFSIEDIEIRNNFVYAVNNYPGGPGFYILDKTNPDIPQVYTPVDDLNQISCSDIKLIDHYAFVAVDEKGLAIIDIDTLNNGKIDQYFLHQEFGQVKNIQIMNDHFTIIITLNDEKEVLKLLDITDKNNIKMLASYSLDDNNDDFVDSFTDNNLFYLLLSDKNNYEKSYFKIFRIENNQLEWVSSSEAQPFLSYHFFIKNKYVYITSDYGIVIYDVSNPELPLFVSQTFKNAALGEIYVYNSDAYIAMDTVGVFKFDVSDPALPKEIGCYKNEGFINKIKIIDSTMTIALTNGIIEYDINSLPSNLTLSSHLKENDCLYTTVKVYDHFAFMIDENYGIKIYDIDIPENPQLITDYTIKGRFKDFILCGDYLFAVDDTHFKIIKLNHLYNSLIPQSQTVISEIFLENASSIAIYGDYIYIISDCSKLSIYNISDIFIPKRIKISLYLAISIFDIVINDHYAYMTGPLGLKIMDIANPELPKLLAENPLISGYTILVNKNYAYIKGSDGLAIVNIDTPDNPIPINFGSNNNPDNFFKISDYVEGPYDPFSNEMQMAANYLFIADRNGGLQILDVFDPNNISIVGSYPSANHTLSVDINNQFIYLADGKNGLTVLKINSK